MSSSRSTVSWGRGSMTSIAPILGKHLAIRVRHIFGIGRHEMGVGGLDMVVGGLH